jgi:hypothetical protein
VAPGLQLLTRSDAPTIDNDKGGLQFFDQKSHFYNHDILISIFAQVDLDTLAIVLPCVNKTINAVITKQFLQNHSLSLLKFVVENAPRLEPERLFCLASIRKAFGSVNELIRWSSLRAKNGVAESWKAAEYQGCIEFPDNYSQKELVESAQMHLQKYGKVYLKRGLKLAQLVPLVDSIVVDERLAGAVVDALFSDTGNPHRNRKRIIQLIRMCVCGPLLLEHIAKIGDHSLTHLLLFEQNLPEPVAKVLTKYCTEDGVIQSVEQPFTDSNIRENIHFFRHLNIYSLARVIKAYLPIGLDHVPEHVFNQINRFELVKYFLEQKDLLEADQFVEVLAWLSGLDLELECVGMEEFGAKLARCFEFH